MPDLRVPAMGLLSAPPIATLALATAQLINLTRRTLAVGHRAVAVWATRVIAPGAELAAALKEVADLRDALGAAQADRECALREWHRLRERFRAELDPERPLDPDSDALPYVDGQVVRAARRRRPPRRVQP